MNTASLRKTNFCNNFGKLIDLIIKDRRIELTQTAETLYILYFFLFWLPRLWNKKSLGQMDFGYLKRWQEAPSRDNVERNLPSFSSKYYNLTVVTTLWTKYESIIMDDPKESVYKSRLVRFLYSFAETKMR